MSVSDAGCRCNKVCMHMRSNAGGSRGRVISATLLVVQAFLLHNCDCTHLCNRNVCTTSKIANIPLPLLPPMLMQADGGTRCACINAAMLEAGIPM